MRTRKCVSLIQLLFLLLLWCGLWMEWSGALAVYFKQTEFVLLYLWGSFFVLKSSCFFGERVTSEFFLGSLLLGVKLFFVFGAQNKATRSYEHLQFSKVTVVVS